MLVAGVPGAGKSTLLRRVPAGVGVAILDSDTQRDRLAALLPAGLPYRRYRWLVHVLHRLAIVRAAASRNRVVAVHLPATAWPMRAAIGVLATLTGRAAHLAWLDVDPAAARAGQVRRDRVVPSGCFAAHARRAAATTAALRAGHVPWGYTGVTVLGRADDPDVLARLVRHDPAEVGQ